jgi:hypothetical protein
MAALGQHSSGLVQALLGAAGGSRESAAKAAATLSARRARRMAPVGAGRHTDQFGEATAEGAQRRAADLENSFHGVREGLGQLPT